MSNDEKTVSRIYKGLIFICAFLLPFSLIMLSASPSLIPYVSSHNYSPLVIGSFYLPNAPSDGFSLIYLPPEGRAYQPLKLPSPLSCVFGLVASSQPVKFKVYGIHPVPVVEPGVLPSWQDVLLDAEVSSTFFAVYPPAKDYVVIAMWENQGDQPVLIITQNNVTFLTVQGNTLTTLYYSLLFIGILTLAFTIIGIFFKPSPPEILEGAGDVFVETLKLTPRALPYLILPVGFLFSIQYLAERLSYVLIQIQSYSTNLPSAWSQASLMSFIASLLATILLGVIATGFIIAFVHRIVEHGRPALLESLDMSLRRYLKLVATTITVALIVTAGLLLFVVPGIYFATIYALAPQAVIVEGAGVREALRRSKELTSGAKLKTLALILLFGVIYLIVGELVSYMYSSVTPIQLQSFLLLSFLHLLLPYPPLDFNLVTFVFPAMFGACLAAGFLTGIVITLYLTGFTLWFYALGGGSPQPATLTQYKTKALECLACGRNLPENANYCPYCGEKLQ